MRCLNKNKVTLWAVKPLGKTEVLDADGFFTGEFTSSFSTPFKVKLSIYPVKGDLEYGLEGDWTDVSMKAVGIALGIDRGDLLYYNEPLDNFESTFDFRVKVNLASITSNLYGLESRR